MKTSKNVLLLAVLVNMVVWGPFFYFGHPTIGHPTKNPNPMLANLQNHPHTIMGSTNWIATETKKINSLENNISPGALKAGLTAYQKARQEGLDDKQVLTIIDYTKPSREHRLLVVDIKNQKVLFNTLVAHGSGSGDAKATSFSNTASSLKSSLGVYITSDVYSGKHGESLRVQGLEPGFNDNAYRRAIVFHSAWYVSENIAKERGMLGRSWGCMAVSQNTINPLINTIKGKTIVVVYYPNEKWEKESKFL